MRAPQEDEQMITRVILSGPRNPVQLGSVKVIFRLFVHFLID